MKHCHCITVVGIISAFSTFAQGWSSKDVPLPADLTALRLVLIGPPPCHSIIGVKVDGSANASLSMTEIIRDTVSYRGAGLQKLSGAKALGPDRFSFDGNTLTLSCDGNPNAVLAVYASVKTKLNVSLSDSASTMSSLQVSNGIVIRDGLAANITPEGMHHLVVATLSPYVPASSAASSAGFLGSTVSPADAKTHIQNYVQPVLASPGVRGPGAMRIEIDESGHVSEVSGSSTTMLDSQALQTIRNWTFQPFISGGKPTKAAIAIVFHIDESGAVHTSLDPSARVY